MCDIIVINATDIDRYLEIETVQGFMDYFGCLPIGASMENYLGGCLCNCDLEATFEALKLSYGVEDGITFYINN